MHVLQWLHTNGHKPTTNFAHEAASDGQALKWLLSIGWDWDDLHCEIAAGWQRQHHPTVTLWAIDNGPDSVHHSMCELAAGFDQLDVLQWLRERGCRWDRQRCVAAAVEAAADGLGDATLVWLLERED